MIAKKVSISIAAMNALLVLYIALIKYHFPNVAVVIVVSLILAQIWYFLSSCAMTEYALHKSHANAYKFKFNIVGVTFVMIHIVLFVYIYNIATASKAQSPLAWIYMEFVDFPLAPLFHILLPLIRSLKVAAVIVYGVFGALLWYSIPHCIYKTYIRYKSR